MPSKDITFCDDTSCVEVYCPRNWTEWLGSDTPVSMVKFLDCEYYGKVDDETNGGDR